jgi:hypothetical protein
VEDKHIFSIAADGNYSTKSAYDGLFVGSTSFGHYHLVWKTWAPPKCRFFLWLAANKRCWPTDRLTKRGLDHPARCLFVTRKLKLLTISLSLVCSQGCSGLISLNCLGFQSLAPHPGHSSFMTWWEQISGMATSLLGKGLNSLAALGAWTT